MKFLELSQEQIFKMQEIAAKLLGKPYRFSAEVDLSSPPEKIESLDCCLTAESTVFCERGFIKIKDIKTGDKAFCFNNNVLDCKKVIAVKNQGIQKVYELKCYHRTIECTGNHPFLTVQKEKIKGLVKTKNNIEYYRKGNSFHLAWKKLEELKEGDYLVAIKKLPLEHKIDHIDSSNDLFSDIKITPNFMRFLGAYIGDGSISGYSVFLCIFEESEIKFYSDLIQKLFNVPVKFYPTAGITFNHRQLVDFLTVWNLKRPSYEKTIPEWVFQTGEQNIRELLNGYLDTDGSLSKRGYYEFKASSRILIEQVRYLYMSLGYYVSNVSEAKRTKDIYIKGVKVKNAKSLWCFEVYPNERNKSNENSGMKGKGYYGIERLDLNSLFGFTKIHSIEYKGEKETYDLEIEDTHNFIANGLVVHNSELVEYLFHQIGIRVPDGSYNQYDSSEEVKLEEAKVGDLLFTKKNSRVNHVCIVISNTKVIEASGFEHAVVSKGIFAFTRFYAVDKRKPLKSQYAGIRRLLAEKVVKI